MNTINRHIIATTAATARLAELHKMGPAADAAWKVLDAAWDAAIASPKGEGVLAELEKWTAYDPGLRFFDCDGRAMVPGDFVRWHCDDPGRISPVLGLQILDNGPCLHREGMAGEWFSCELYKIVPPPPDTIVRRALPYIMPVAGVVPEPLVVVVGADGGETMPLSAAVQFLFSNLAKRVATLEEAGS